MRLTRNTKILIAIVIIILLYIIYENCNQVNYDEFKGSEPGPQILIVGGTHGNEPSGSRAIHNLKSNIKSGNITIKRGSLIIIPDVNYYGLKFGIRWNPGNILHPDINRAYPTSPHGEGKCYITQKIKEIADKSNFVLDLHEGYDFYHNNHKSIGSTISPGPTELSLHVAENMKLKVNKKISAEHMKFHIITHGEKDVIKGTLSEYCKCINKDYILIETTGQNNIQPLSIRVDQMTDSINVLLKNLKMI